MACSSDITLPEKLPTPQELFEVLPLISNKGYEKAPLLPAKP
jgi:hypothetical protein